jgi:PEP-CTERM motif-containing protein
MPERPDKTGPNQHFARYQFTGGNNNMKVQKFSLFGTLAGALLLTAVLAPRAEAQTSKLLYYFNFTSSPTNPSDPLFNGPYTSVAPGTFSDGAPFAPTTTTIFNGQAGAFVFPGTGAGAGMTIQTNGTSVNKYSFDTTAVTNNLQLRANDTTGTTQYCFTMGPMDFSGTALPGFQGFSITFALEQLNGGGPGHHGFTSLQLAYSFDNITFTNFPGTTGTFNLNNNLNAYSTLTAPLPTAVNGHSTVYISFCFVGATDTGINNSTQIDNIQVLALTPEPSTYIGGLLGIAGLCWFQRRRLRLILPRLRRTWTDQSVAAGVPPAESKSLQPTRLPLQLEEWSRAVRIDLIW